jgi:hypothetical protein
MADLGCPWCAFAGGGFLPTRTHDDGTEYRCPSCSWRHTRKEEGPDGAYVFFPGDIYAAFSDDVSPHIPYSQAPPPGLQDGH